MVCQWKGYQLQRASYIVFLITLYIDVCFAINSDGKALLAFRQNVLEDPYDALANWNEDASNPCRWPGVNCVEGHVRTLDLRELSLVGKLPSELGKLTHLRILALCKNYFFGDVPKEITKLTKLEVLDLRDNNLNGTVPAELGNLPSLRFLLLGDNDFKDGMISDFVNIALLSESDYDQIRVPDLASGAGCVIKKFGACHWDISLRKATFVIPLKGKLLPFYTKFTKIRSRTQFPITPDRKMYGSIPGPSMVEDKWHLHHLARRELLAVSESNLAALPAPGAPAEPVTSIPSRGSGSFPAISKSSIPNGKSSPPSGSISPFEPSPTFDNADSANGEGKGSNKWKYIYVVPAGVFFLCIAGAVLYICRSKGVTTIGPWKTGLSGQLQKAFVSGVPKLNRAELETACEDFSNIVTTYPYCTVYKGTLSSGVEIAVAVSSVKSAQDWSKGSEQHFRKKIDRLSRVNHKNFVNLIGYCEEDEPFLRVMVFEYAPSGTLFEHLHVKEVEHLDWPARMRILMGVAYCLQYMHHELSPPVVHPSIQSSSILLTDDNSAKVTEVGFWKYFVAKEKIIDDNDIDNSEYPSEDTESNVFSFGLLMLEIISGRRSPQSKEQGSLVSSWAADYVDGKVSASYILDPTLKTFKSNELDIICEVIPECINEDPRRRPTMKEIANKLREVIPISPEAATPRLSPLWWAELEILSVEAS